MTDTNTSGAEPCKTCLGFCGDTGPTCAERFAASGADVLAAIEKLIDRYSDDCASDGAEGLAYPSVAASLSRDIVNAAVAALIARNAELEAERDARNACIQMIYAELQHVAPWSESNDMETVDEIMCGIGLLAQSRDAIAAEVKALRETLEIVKANAVKTLPIPGRPATGAQWIIGFATDNLALSFDQVFDNAIAVARASASTGDA